MVSDGGYRRICPQCKAEHFPRTDPAVIMLVTAGDRCLLGRNNRRIDQLHEAISAESPGRGSIFNIRV